VCVFWVFFSIFRVFSENRRVLSAAVCDRPRPLDAGCRGDVGGTIWHGGGARGSCWCVCFGCFSAYFVFLAKIDVCRVRPCVIGRAPLLQGVVGMLEEQFGTAGGRGGVVGVCVLGVFQHISCFWQK
jgi:hypothetical protein